MNIKETMKHKEKMKQGLSFNNDVIKKSNNSSNKDKFNISLLGCNEKESYKTPRIRLNLFTSKSFGKDRTRSKALLFSTSTPATKKNKSRNTDKDIQRTANQPSSNLVSFFKQRKSNKIQVQTSAGSRDKKMNLNQSLTKQRNIRKQTTYQSNKSKASLNKHKAITQNSTNEHLAKIRINSKLHIVLKKIVNVKTNERKQLTRNSLQNSNLSIPLKRKESDDRMTVIENDCDNDYSLICNSLNLLNN